MNVAQIKQTIGDDVYDRLEKQANAEVGLALAMPLIDQYRREKWYQQRYLIPDLLPEIEHFHKLGLKFTPVDVINVLFRCKLAFALNVEDEYHRRAPGSLADESGFLIHWAEKADGYDTVVDRYLERMQGFIQEQTLITELSHFDNTPIIDPARNLYAFWEELFRKLDAPFSVYFDEPTLIEKHRIEEPHLRAYSQADAKRYFCAPSLGFTANGTTTYVYLYAGAWLRTFLDMLRVASFVYHTQIDFGQSGVELLPPQSPVILGRHSFGVNCWDEDAKKPWLRIPDGCLFLSFGYRGVSKMWLDDRAYAGIEKFMLEHKVIFDYLKNPWSARCIDDVAPAIEILSAATQVMDLGAKILLLYCCLEHLFVPAKMTEHNTKYIVGGIHALSPDLLPWFDRMYKIRCMYAHRGYVLKTDEVRGLVFESVANVAKLLVMKLANAR